MRNSPMCLTHKGDGFIHFFCIYHVLRAWHKRPLGKCSSTVTLTALSTPLLSCQLPWSVLLHYKRLISFNVLQWVLSGRHCICESFLSTQQLCQWPQFSGVIALGLGTEFRQSYLCLREEDSEVSHQYHTQDCVSGGVPGVLSVSLTLQMFCLVHLISELLSSLFPGWWHWHFDWIFFFFEQQSTSLS